MKVSRRNIWEVSSPFGHKAWVVCDLSQTAFKRPSLRPYTERKLETYKRLPALNSAGNPRRKTWKRANKHWTVPTTSDKPQHALVSAGLCHLKLINNCDNTCNYDRHNPTFCLVCFNLLPLCRTGHHWKALASAYKFPAFFLYTPLLYLRFWNHSGQMSLIFNHLSKKKK
jgi:hypothetical protein